MYCDIARKCSEQIGLYGGGMIAVIPTIVYDEDDNEYEGISLFINNSGNKVDLSIEELEATLYCLAKVDFFMYSQSIMNYFIYYYKVDTDHPLPSTEKSNLKRGIVKPSIDWNSGVKATANFRKGSDELEQLMNLHNE